MNDRESGAYEQLYQFLWACFIRADVNKSGRVGLDQFEALIEEAAELPRMYGFAPKSEDMFPSVEMRKAARAKLFNELDTKKLGYITVPQWMKYALLHIQGKYVQLPKDYLSGASAAVGKDEFIAFIKRAVDPQNKEYEELYYFLLRTFQAGDKGGYGEVGAAEFDEMVECAATAPRKYGLAPPSDQMFKDDNDRFLKRIVEFSKVDYHGQGYITFNEWLKYAMDHIRGKARGI